MQLLEFRQFFRKHSGRHDLVNADGSDNGVDVLIGAGQKYIDRLTDIPAGLGRVFKDVVDGDFIVTFEQCRSIHEVWCTGRSDGTLTRLPLTKYNQKDLRGVDELTGQPNFTELANTIAHERPQYYAPAMLRLITDNDGLSGGFGSQMDVQAKGFQTYSGVYFLPPADGNYVIEVVGNFYSEDYAFPADTWESFWLAQHFMILYMATMREIEIIYRNTAGVADWERSIKDSLMTLDMDGVKEESIDCTEMEG